jgi:hypothetical protein
MPMQIVENPNASSRLFGALGSGLGEGLAQLAQNKVQEVQGAKFWSSLGLPQETALAFARAPESVQKSLLDRLEGIGLGGGQEQSSQQQINPQVNELGRSIQEQVPSGIRLGANSQERRHREILNEQKLARHSKENAAAFKATDAYRTELNNKAESAEGNLFRIKEAMDLEKEGNLNSQAYLTFLNAAGLENVEGLLSGDTQAYNKILADFQKGAKDVYNGRITNQDLDQFLKTIPSLYQSPQGRSRIFKMMEYWNKGDVEKQKIAQKITKENGGVPPYDIHEKVIKRSKPVIDHIAKQFKESLKEALTLTQKQQGSSKSSVAAAQIAGTAAKPVGGALLGAGIGSVFPGVGTALGAGVGAGLGSGLNVLSKYIK